MERTRFIDTLAVKYKSSSDALQERHVAKRKQRNRDLEIVFDPELHKDFVTGFRRRKQQRRKEAVKSLEKLQRENKLEERAERREARREQYDLANDDKELANTDTKDAGANPNDVEHIFYGRDTRSTVKVSVIPTAFEEEGGKQITRNLDLTLGSDTKNAKVDQQKRGRAGHKLSKTALTVLSNTKLKIEGKRKFSISSAKKSSKSAGSSKGKEKARKGRK